MKELRETSYQFTGDFLLDSSAATATFGLEPTPLEEGAHRTVAWWSARLAGTEAVIDAAA